MRIRAALKKVVRPVADHVTHAATRRALPALERLPHPFAKPIAQAVRETIDGDISRDEAALIDRIEQRRAALGADESLIEFMDFGAGKADNTRSLEEAAHGHATRVTVQQVAQASKSPRYCLLLYKLIRHLEPDTVLEMGTCVGISASYQAAALKKNGRGRLKTLEGAQEVARIARKTLEINQLDNADVVTGPFHETLLAEMQGIGRIDFLFNDGHHDGAAVLQYFEQSVPYLASPAIVFVDDINWSDSMNKSWQALKTDARTAFSVDFGANGLVVWDPDAGSSTDIVLKI
ncbi:O-methyltransferase [Cognatishimia sp. F0-27]|uniref:O-methyltransferase n=1 Tax=Cognatishimia sp. F0-27 TaxID=2816855 RepID=UPI001D0C73B2|nr:class I SAM-dependent methyltransferase [Cognatishimia sp. F0-27]MCC1494835.1 class I SAM-dependent methyltransferase [Cognatishimia sp. F0-27]